MLQVGRLVILAGPSASGKSFLIERLRAGDFPDLCDQLGVHSHAPGLYVEAWNLPALQQQQIDRMILHYDLYAQSIADGDFRYLPDLLPQAEHITVLTLRASTELLQQRISARLIPMCNAFVARPDADKAAKIRWLRDTVVFYRDAANLDALYEKWDRFVTARGIEEHLYLDSNAVVTSRPGVSLSAVRAEVAGHRAAY
jgi:hypothetical protein